MKIRLDKFLSNNTGFSRNHIHKLIKCRYIFVNGFEVNDIAIKIDPEKDQISIQDEEIKTIGNVYIALNKPKQYLCTNSFEEECPSILTLINEPYVSNLHIIGRLDKDTTGLIILTNDGEFTHRIKNPRSNIDKEYEVILEKEITKEMINKLKQPIKMDGKLLKPNKLSNINGNKCNICIQEGKYHQIKRLFEIVGNKVIELNRIRIGNLKLYDLNLDLSKYCFIEKEMI